MAAAAAANATATVNMMSKNQAAKATAAVVVVPPHSLGAPFSTSFFLRPFLQTALLLILKAKSLERKDSRVH